MTDKPKKPLTEAETKARSLSRWENEGGAKSSRATSGKKPKRPRDPNQLAKMIVDIATGEVPEAPSPSPKTERGAVSLMQAALH